MKAAFNKNWNRSVQPRKQVKYRANAPLHIKRKFLSALLDKPLREKIGKRNVTLRKGDTVKIMRGSFAKKSGKVELVDVGNTRIQIAGLQRAKKGGEKVVTWFNPSNVKIVEMVTSDKKRSKKKLQNEEASKQTKKAVETKQKNNKE